MTKPSIAVIGAGIGGLTAAALLERRGYDVQVYEQATRFARIGAGIQQSANAVKVLRSLGLEPRLRASAFQPKSWNNREWDTGAVKFELELGESFETRYGAPYLLMHRGDLHAAIASAVPEERVHRGRTLVGLEQDGAGVTMRFADGGTARADALVGADGVHSVVREWLFGAEEPRFTGRVAYRTTFPASRLQGFPIDDCTKWWGPDRHIVIYFVTPRRDEVYFVTSVPEPEWRTESWSAKGDLAQLRAAYEGFHPQVQAVLHACPEVYKWALYEREPMPRWGEGRVVLLGDACHPMTPYMAQGAASSIEDGAVLARCLDAAGSGGPEEAFARYAATRQPRTAQIQGTSHRNDWLSRRTDPDWVYGYDPLWAPLADPVAA
jgi:salicylate hydroxylase/6-hydroxynicotinate 3-monooxygenase